MANKEKIEEMIKLIYDFSDKMRSFSDTLEESRKSVYDAFKKVESSCMACEDLDFDYTDSLLWAQEYDYNNGEDDDKDEDVKDENVEEQTNSNEQTDTEEITNEENSENSEHYTDLDDVIFKRKSAAERKEHRVGKYKYEPYNWMDKYEFKDAPIDMLYEKLADAAVGGVANITLISKGVIARHNKNVTDRDDVWSNIRESNDHLDDFFKCHDEVCAILATLEYRNERMQKALKEFKRMLANNEVFTTNHGTDDIYSVFDACFLPQWTIVKEFVDKCMDVDYYDELHKLNITAYGYDVSYDYHIDSDAAVDGTELNDVNVSARPNVPEGL